MNIEPTNTNDGCLTFPFRILGDLIRSLKNPQTRTSSSIIIGAIGISCLVLFGASSLLGSNGSSPESIAPTNTQIVAISIAQTSYAADLLTQAAPSPLPLLTATPTTSLFAQTTLADYPRVAASQFQTLQSAFAEFVPVYQQLVADPSLSQNNDWRSQSNSILDRLVTSANELAALNNVPAEYSAFHQHIQALAGEVNLLQTNYSIILNNQDPNAINQATANLSNAIGYFNQAHSVIQTLNVTPTLIPSRTPLPIPTATIVFIFPTQPPSSGGSGSFDNNGDGKVTCKDFQTQAAAQQAYNAGYTALDGNDNDGRACESLP